MLQDMKGVKEVVHVRMRALFQRSFAAVTHRYAWTSAAAALGVAALFVGLNLRSARPAPAAGKATTAAAVAHDTSGRLAPDPDADNDATADPDEQAQPGGGSPAEAPHDPAGAKVEQTAVGTKPALPVLESFDGLGVGFEGPQGDGDNAQSVGQQPRRRSRITSSRS